MEDISGRFILSRLGKKRDQSLKVNIVSLIQSLHFIYVLCIILNNRNKEYNTNFYHLISNNKKIKRHYLPNCATNCITKSVGRMASTTSRSCTAQHLTSERLLSMSATSYNTLL